MLLFYKYLLIDVFIPIGIKIVSLSLGASHGIALSADGTLYAWGTHERAQLSRPLPQVLNALNPPFKANGKIIYYFYFHL